VENLREYVVPVFLTIEAESAEAARDAVVYALSSDGFEWPLPVTVSCVGNLDEVTE